MSTEVTPYDPACTNFHRLHGHCRLQPVLRLCGHPHRQDVKNDDAHKETAVCQKGKTVGRIHHKDRGTAGPVPASGQAEAQPPADHPCHSRAGAVPGGLYRPGMGDSGCRRNLRRPHGIPDAAPVPRPGRTGSGTVVLHLLRRFRLRKEAPEAH